VKSIRKGIVTLTLGLGTYRITVVPDPPSSWTPACEKWRQDLRAAA
jgi:hypothetical protein